MIILRIPLATSAQAGPIIDYLTGRLVRFRIGGQLQCRALVVAVRSARLPEVAELARCLGVDHILYGDTVTRIRKRVLPAPTLVFEDTQPWVRPLARRTG